MKKYIVILLAFATVCALFSGCMSVNLVNLVYPDADRYSVGETELDAAYVSVLDVDWSSGKVELVAGKENTVRISETAAKELESELAVHWLLENGTLHIKFCAPGSFNIKSLNKTLTVTVPEGVILKKLGVSTASADVESEIAAVNISASTASGKIGLDCTGAENAYIDSASGDVTVTGTGSIGELEISTASGKVNADFENVRSAEIDTASGAVRFRAEKLREGSFDSASGNVTIEAADTPSELDVETASGSVTLCLPADADFAVEIDTASGNFESDFALKKRGDTYICGDGFREFDIETASGDIYITEK